MQNIHAMTMFRGGRATSLPGIRAPGGGRAARAMRDEAALPAGMPRRRHAQDNGQGDAPVALSLRQFILVLIGLSALGLVGGAWLAARLLA